MSPTSKTTHICLLPIGGTKSHCFSASDILCGPKGVSAQCHRCATEQDGRGALNNVLGSGSARSLLVAASVRPRTKTSRHRELFVPNISTSIPRLSISIRVRWLVECGVTTDSHCSFLCSGAENTVQHFRGCASQVTCR